MGKDILCIWQSPHIGSFSFGIKSVIVGRPSRSYEPFNPLPAKIINQGQNYISGSFIDYMVLKWWASSYLPPGGGENQMDARIVEDYKLNCVVATIAAAMPDVVFLLQQFNKAWSTWHVAIDMAHMFFSISIRKGDQTQHLKWTTDHIYNIDLGSINAHILYHKIVWKNLEWMDFLPSITLRVMTWCLSVQGARSGSREWAINLIKFQNT